MLKGESLNVIANKLGVIVKETTVLVKEATPPHRFGRVGVEKQWKGGKGGQRCGNRLEPKWPQHM